MKPASLLSIKLYLLGFLRHLKTSFIFFLVFALIYRLMGREYAEGGTKIAFLIALLSFACTFFTTLRAYLRSMSMVKSRGWGDQAAADFDAAQKAPGICRIGDHYFFGYSTGVLVNLHEVACIIKDVQYVEDSDSGHKRRRVSLKFRMNDGSTPLLCSLYNRTQYRRAGEALALLKDKCPMSEEALALCDKDAQ